MGEGEKHIHTEETKLSTTNLPTPLAHMIRMFSHLPAGELINPEGKKTTTKIEGGGGGGERSKSITHLVWDGCSPSFTKHIKRLENEVTQAPWGKDACSSSRGMQSVKGLFPLLAPSLSPHPPSTQSLPPAPFGSGINSLHKLLLLPWLLAGSRTSRLVATSQVEQGTMHCRAAAALLPSPGFAITSSFQGLSVFFFFFLKE